MAGPIIIWLTLPRVRLPGRPCHFVTGLLLGDWIRGRVMAAKRYPTDFTF